MRRKKKLIIKISIVVSIIILAVALFFIFFKIRKPIQTTDDISSNIDATPITVEVGPNIDIQLPNKIIDVETNTITTTNTTNTVSENENEASEPESSPDAQNSNNKTYTPLVEETSSVYFVTLNPRGDNEVRILIGPDSEKLLDKDSDVKVGVEYPINNVPEDIKTETYFTIDNYDYPILLLLGNSGKLYYVNIEKAYKYGSFNVDGFIQDIPEVEGVYATTVEKDNQKYRSAVITCTNGEGYEFNLNMIGIH